MDRAICTPFANCSICPAPTEPRIERRTARLVSQVPGRGCVRIATRGSKLALAQTEYVVDQVRRRWPTLEVSLVAVSTYGDRHRAVPLVALDAPDGVFTRGVEAELMAGRAEVAVHSLK